MKSFAVTVAIKIALTAQLTNFCRSTNSDDHRDRTRGNRSEQNHLRMMRWPYVGYGIEKIR
jgi:hypothetical protein